MSGFVGFTKELTNREAVLDAMLAAIAHRGPDSSETYLDDYLALGFGGLQVSDQTDATRPVFNAAADKLIVLDGQIYNHQDLQAQLIDQGHRFTTTTAAEVVLAGYEQYGPDVLDKLRGMWAFVIYDLKTRELFGARDYFGIKPLYYHICDGALLFASEIKAFAQHPNFTPQLNTAVLGTYLNFGFVPGTDTLFKNVFKLAPGSYFQFRDPQFREERLTTTAYHCHTFAPDYSKSFDYWVQQISSTLKDSLRCHQTAEVAIGSFLSSGVDSSYMAKLSNDISPTKTFSAAYAEDQYSELPFARDFARRYNLENYAAEITSDSYFSVVEKVVYHLDEPLADPSCLSLYFVCNKASQQVKAAFSGEGADELFAGYNPYRDGLRMDNYQKVPLSLRKCVAAAAGILPNATPGKDFFIRGAKPIEQRYFQAGNFIFDPQELDKVLLDNNSITPKEVVAPFYAQTLGAETVSRMQAVDLNVWATGDILLKADKMSMANSLEIRTPFLDREVSKLAGQIPAKDKVSRSDTKISLRAAARRDIDDATASKKKLGFPVPLRDWLRKEKYVQQIREAFSSDVAGQYFDTAYLNQLIDDHQSNAADTYRKVWAVYIFLVWHETFIAQTSDTA
ncbi:MAG: asparagine synthase (glutamine-hydrolyzing) [Coriobacteriia bacterium]|nr:asparagine synthase (glutamine-hydrolyzing) [Coriobacteriia bacterium]